MLGGCSNKTLTFDEAKVRAQEIDTYWTKDGAKIPAKSTFTGKVKGNMLGVYATMDTTEKYDRDAKYLYNKSVTTVEGETFSSEMWIYYDDSTDKTYFVYDEEDKDYFYDDGDTFEETMDFYGSAVESLHYQMGLSDIFALTHTEGEYKSKGEGHLYAKFKVVKEGIELEGEIDIQDYLIHKMFEKSDSLNYEYLVTATYKSFTLTKPNLSDYTLIS